MTASGKTIGILIARMTSSRLPGKSLRLVAGKPLVKYVLEGLQAVTGLDEIWLATTSHPEDQPLVEWAQDEGINVLAYDGSVDDVVGRVSAVLNASRADQFIVALGDSPFVDPRLLSHKLDTLNAHPEWDCVWIDPLNGQHSSHCGMLCFRTAAWRIVDAASILPTHREHLASIVFENPDLIRQGQFQDDPIYYSGPYRMSVDTQADLDFVTHIFETLQRDSSGRIPFVDVMHYLNANPQVTAINAHVRQRKVAEHAEKVLFIVQYSPTSGLGHLNRCRTLAKTLQEYHSVSTQFYLIEIFDVEDLFPSPCGRGRGGVNPQALKTDLRHSNCSISATPPARGEEILIPMLNTDNDINPFPGDFNDLKTAIQNNRFQRIVLDLAEPITKTQIQLLRTLNSTCPLIVLDNIGPGVSDADFLILPNAHSPYPSSLSLPAERILMGPTAILLGAAFLTGVPKTNLNPNKPSRLLITMGGSDPCHITQKILDAVSKLNIPAGIDVIVPPLANFDISNAYPSNIRFHHNIQNLIPFMQEATVACCGFGVTAYELAAMGVPALIFAHHPNQQQDLAAFCAHGSAINMGCGESCEAIVIVETLKALLEDDVQRLRMTQNGQTLVSGCGSRVIAQAILSVQPVHAFEQEPSIV